MRPVIMYLAASLDGYIADGEGSVDWLDDPNLFVEGEDHGYHAFYDTIDTTLMGNRTYQDVLGFDVPFPYPDKENFVFSRTPHDDGPHVKMISSDVAEFVAELKKKEGKGIWLVGGSQLNSVLLRHGLIDRIILTVAPVILGEGIPIFAETKWFAHLNLIKCQPFSKGWVQLTYDFKADSQ